ncbi:uroporphyrinogen decarboxylase family protein [Candidatus Poribacteria bacterium]
MVTSFGIIDGLLRDRPVPRMGLREVPWQQTLQKWISQGYPVDEHGRPVDHVEHFNHDWGRFGIGINCQPILGYREVLEETDEWVVARDGTGAALKQWKRRAGTPEHIDFIMTSREVWDRDYRPHLLDVNPARLGNTEAIREKIKVLRKQQRWVMAIGPCIFESMRHSMGDFCMYESFLTDPEWIHDFCRVYTDFFIKHYQLAFQQAGLPDGIRLCEDLGYRNGLFCSPKSLSELVFPYYREMVDFFHSQGLFVFLHTCGGVTEALDMIVDAGFDAVDPMERAAGCDPVEFARRTENKLVLTGGFDKRILESGDREAIRREVISLTKSMRDNGVRYVFSTDHSLSTNVDYADYLYMLEVFRDNMYY